MRTSATLEQIVKVIRREVSKLRSSENDQNERDAYSLERALGFYLQGSTGIIPDEWEKYAKQAEKEADGDYATYLKLKAKFEK
jgi:hypothetical protein